MRHASRSLALALSLGLVLAMGSVTPAQAKAPASTPADLKYPSLPDFKIPSPQRVELKNGIVVLMLPSNELPLVEGRILIKTGSRDEPADKIGLATIVGEVLRTGGTTTRTGDDIDDMLGGIGAEIESSIEEDQGSIRFSCLSGNLDAVLALLSEMLQKPAFLQDKIDVVKTQIKSGIARRNDDVQGIAGREFSKLVYGADSVYARQEEYATIDAIKREDVVAFHRANYHPNRVLIGVTGDFTTSQLKRAVDKHFGSWKKGPDVKPMVGGYQKEVEPGIYYVEKTDVNQTNVRLGHLGILRNNPDYYAVTVMNEILGGGFSSRLFSEVRSNKGLAYAVWGSVNSDYDHPSTTMIGVMTKSETTVEAIRALHEEVKKIRTSAPSADEMKRAKDSILNSFVFNFDTRGEVLSRQLTYEYFGYPIDFLEQYRKKIETVEAADVLRVAKTYLHPDRMVQLAVGNGPEFGTPLSDLGKVTTIDVTIPAPAGETKPKATAESLAKGKKVVARAVTALGGGAALDAVKAVKETGEISMQTPMGEQKMKMTRVAQLPDKTRLVIQTPGGEMTMVVTPEMGFMSMGAMGQQDLPAARREDSLKEMSRELASLLRNGDLSAQHLGMDEVDGAECDKVLLTAGDVDVTAWVNSDGVVIKDTYTGSGPGGAPGKIERMYSDWRAVGDCKIAHKVDASFEGKPAQSITLESVELNPTLSGDEFVKPAAK